MAVYDYEVRINGTLIVPTLVRHARFLKYTSGMKRGGDLVIPYVHGEYFVPDKYFTNTDVLLEVFLPFDDHAAGAEALSDLQLLLQSQSLIPIRQNDPHRGQIRAMVELVTDPVSTQDEFTYLFGLNNPKGFWEANSASTATGNPPAVTTSGDRPIDDMILTFAGPGFFEHEDSLGVISRVEIDPDAPAGTYIVDVGAKTVTEGGDPADVWLIINRPWWMKFSPDEAQDLDTDVSVTVDWRNKWA